MKVFQLKDMQRGWFVGDFFPTAYLSKDCEVACKHYKAGDQEEPHLHQVATEITLIVSGRVEMNGRRFNSGDIIMLSPGESADFKVLEDSINLVVKIPSSKGDKYLLKNIDQERS